MKSGVGCGSARLRREELGEAVLAWEGVVMARDARVWMPLCKRSEVNDITIMKTHVHIHMYHNMV